MFRSLVVVIFLVVSVATALEVPAYPKFTHVFKDPATYDLLYSSSAASSGEVNETLRFTRPLRLFTVVVPAQVIDLAGQDFYDEDVTVRVYQRLLDKDTTTLVGDGRYFGSIHYGREVTVRIYDVNGGATEDPPTMELYQSPAEGSEYLVSVAYSKGGFYPWYNTRNLSSSASVDASCDVEGLVIGFSYMLV